MNTPFGNSITTAEHAISHDAGAGARDFPPPMLPRRPANGKRTASWAWRSPAKYWVSLVPAISDRSSRIAQKVCKMRVIAFDPYLSPEARCWTWASRKLELNDLLARADFITPARADDGLKRHATSCHADAINENEGAACASSIARAAACSTRRALADAHRVRPGGRGRRWTSSRRNPAKDSPLFGLENVVCTPHLGASTNEAQEKRGVAGGRADERFPADRGCHERHQTPPRSAPRTRRACAPTWIWCSAWAPSRAN